MVANRRSGHTAILPLMVLLAAVPRTEMPPPYLPGEPRRPSSSKKCQCGGVFVKVKGKVGKHCQRCGAPPPKTKQLNGRPDAG